MPFISEMEDQILVALDEAEKNVAKLKALIQSRPAEERPRTSGSSSESPAAATLSNESVKKPYMTLSTTKLFETRGIEEFRIDGSVGLYFIVPNTRIRTAARSAILRIVRIEVKYQDESHPPAFVQVGDWVYPLMPGSMVYRSEQKYYLFPDLISTIPGSSVGVILPQTCSAEKRATFEELLLSHVGMSEFPSQPPESFGKSTDLILAARTSVQLVKTKSGIYSQRTSQGQAPQSSPQNTSANTSGGVQTEGQFGKRIGAGIKAGGELLSRGLELGAIGTANAISLGASCLKKNLPRDGNTREIPAAIVDGVACAKETTDKVVELSASILTTLADITSNFATLTACYVRASAAPLVESLVEASGISNWIDQEKIDQVAGEFKELGEGIAGGTVEAYRGLENAGRIMANAVRDQTCEVVEHCYGPSAARVLQGAGNVVGNVAVSGRNAGQALSPKKIAYKALNDAGLALCKEKCP